MKFFEKGQIFENNLPAQAPVDEIQTLYDKTLKCLDEDMKVPNDVLNSFQIKDQLNPEFWKGDKLLPAVRHKLTRIALDFIKELELPELKLKDALFVGSLANYNWSKYSDIDLHLVVDYAEFDESPDFIQKFFDAQKKLFNLKHKIEINGYPVEVYVQNLKHHLEASAVYSVIKDKWLLMPERKKFKVDKSLIKRKVERFFDKLKEIKKNYDAQNFKKVLDDVNVLWDGIKKMRQSGLERGGEFSTENIIFKVLRRTDIMDMLDTYKVKAYDHLASIK